MKIFHISAAVALLAFSVSAAPAPAAEASPENVDAGKFLEKAYIWGSYKKVAEEDADAEGVDVEKREAQPEDVDAGKFLEKAYVWGSYAKVAEEP